MCEISQVWSLYVKGWGTSIAVLRFSLVEREKSKTVPCPLDLHLAPIEVFDF